MSVKVYFKGQMVAEHERSWHKLHTKITAKGHHLPFTRKGDKQSCPQEFALKGHDDMLDQYVKELKRRSPGRGTRQLSRLLNLKQTYPKAAFLPTLKLALEYGLFDLARAGESHSPACGRRLLQYK